MHFSDMGSEELLQGSGTYFWVQSQWFHQGENRRLPAELG